MKKFINMIFVPVLFISGNADAAIVNGGFEDGLNGWSTVGYAHQVGHWSSEGDYSVMLTPTTTLSTVESSLGVTANSLNVVADYLNPSLAGPIDASTLYQSFSVNAGDQINFEFDVKGTQSDNNWEYMAVAFIESGVLSDYYSITQLVSEIDADCGCYCDLGEGEGVFNASSTGDALISFLIMNEGDASVDPYIKLDNISAIITPVPVPPAVWLFGSGLIGMIAFARRNKL